MSYTVRSLLIFLASVLFIFVYLSTAQAAVLQMDREEIIQRSKLILVGTILEKNPRWNKKKTLIVTDYRLKVDEVLFGEANKEITLTFAGGFLPGEGGHRVSGVPSFTVGEQVLLMLDSYDRPSFSPVTGMYQGSFSANNFNDAEQRNRNKPISFENFINMVKQEIPTAKSKPLPDRSVPNNLRQFNRKDLPSKIYDPSPVAPSENNVTRPPLSREKSNSLLNNGTGETSHNFIYEKKQPAPIVFYPLPESFNFGKYDQYQMAYWNKYADIFQVKKNVDNKWGWKNDRNEIAGFMSSADMERIFGSPWGENTLATTWTRSNDSNVITESDIAFNKKFDWTTNGLSTYRNSNLINFNDTCLHELGHAWGLDHNFNEISVMNYMPHKYSAYERLYLDDAMAIRQAFPSNVVSRTDLGVYFYYPSGEKEVSDADVTVDVSSGGNLTVNNYIIENVGTNTISSPTIEWFLTPEINSFDNAISLGLTTHSSLNRNQQFTRTSVERTLKIPSNVQAGQYYLAAYVRLEEDSVAENNSSWLDRPIIINRVQQVEYVFNTLEKNYSDYFSPRQLTIPKENNYYRLYPNGSGLYLFNNKLWYRIDNSEWIDTTMTITEWYNGLRSQ
jgi:hypothetical protein